MIPCPPHSQAYNRAENTWGRIHGHAHINALRARLGPPAWSLVERGAVFQHNHTPAPRSRSSLVDARTRSEALTLTIFDASTLLGFVGQTGWVHCPDAKSNAFRPSAEPVLYICPATALNAQIVFNLRSFKLNVVADVSFSSDPRACSLLLARSALYRPRGDFSTPDADSYTAQLHALLTWLPDDDSAVVDHDPTAGLPVALTQYQPCLTPDGVLLMLAPHEIDVPHAPAPGSPEAAAPAPRGPVALTLPAPASDPPPAQRDAAPGAAPTWNSLVPTTDVVNDVAHLQAHPATALVFRPGHSKSNRSALRWGLYSRATTFAEFLTLHAEARAAHVAAPSALTDLRWDLAHDLVRLDRPAVRVVRAHIDTEPTSDILRDLARDPSPSAAPPSAMPQDATRTYIDETTTLRLISSYEPAPPPGHPLHPDAEAVPALNNGRQTDAFVAGCRVLRTALVEDHQYEEPPETPLPIAAPDPDTVEFPLFLGLEAAPKPGIPTPPSSVAAARRLPDFDAPHGWRAAITKEITRVEGFNAWSLVRASDVSRAIDEVGADRVSIGHLVAVLTCKLDPAGDPRAPGILNKFRIAIADKADAASGVPTFSSCVDDITNRIITVIASAVGASQTTIDVGGAYYHGTPDPVEAGGRYLFARIPPWLSALFPTQYPALGRNGRPNLLRIVGNMPGRCDGGRIWQRRFDVFLRGYGLTQLMTDRRTWVLTNGAGTLIVHDHVDDSRLTSTTDAARDAFHHSWATTFGEPLHGTPISEDFTGLRHHRLDKYTTAISCEGIILRLQRELIPYPLSATETCTWPLSKLAFERLREETQAAAPMGTPPTDEHLRAAATLIGLIGFIVGLVRADAYFAYAVLCRFITPTRLSPLAFRSLVRLGHYLVSTRHLALHLSAPAPSQHSDGSAGLDLFDTYADAANGNWDLGSGYSGFVLATARDPSLSSKSYGGGALAWRTHLVRAGDDSSGAAELRAATEAYKYTVAARFLQAELGIDVAPTRPTRFYLDANSVLDGYECERLTKATRWMAMRYAMIRWGTACRTILPTKLPSADNPSDGFTKCLTGARFVSARAFLLGYPTSDPPPAQTGNAGAATHA